MGSFGSTREIKENKFNKAHETTQNRDCDTMPPRDVEIDGNKETSWTGLLSSNRQMVRRTTRRLLQNNAISDFDVNLPTSDQIINTLTSLYADYPVATLISSNQQINRTIVRQSK